MLELTSTIQCPIFLSPELVRLSLKRMAMAQKKPLSLEKGHPSFLLVEENGGHRLEKDV